MYSTSGKSEEQLRAETERAELMAAELLAQEAALSARQHKKLSGKVRRREGRYNGFNLECVLSFRMCRM